MQAFPRHCAAGPGNCSGQEGRCGYFDEMQTSLSTCQWLDPERQDPLSRGVFYSLGHTCPREFFGQASFIHQRRFYHQFLDLEEQSKQAGSQADASTCILESVISSDEALVSWVALLEVGFLHSRRVT